jgi:hypothetical protein
MLAPLSPIQLGVQAAGHMAGELAPSQVQVPATTLTAAIQVPAATLAAAIPGGYLLLPVSGQATLQAWVHWICLLRRAWRH